MIVNSSRGGGSKDTWVLEIGERHSRRRHGACTPRASARPARPALRRLDQPASSNSSSGRMLARIAQELFWLGRNLARAEHTSRMLDGVFQAGLQGRPEDPSASASVWARSRSWAPARRAAPTAATRCSTADADPTTPPRSSRASRGRAKARARARRHLRRDVGGDQHHALGLRDGDFARRSQTGPYGVYQDVKERSALFWGLTAGRCCATRRARSWSPAGGSSPPTWSCGCCASRCRPGRRASRPTARRWPAAGRRRLPSLPPRGARAAQRRPGRALPALRARLPGLRRCLGRRGPWRPGRADAAPRSSEPVLRLSRLSADLEFRRARPPPTWIPAEEVQSELGLVDADIAQRYFGGAAARIGDPP